MNDDSVRGGGHEWMGGDGEQDKEEKSQEAVPRRASDRHVEPTRKRDMGGIQ